MHSEARNQYLIISQCIREYTNDLQNEATLWRENLLVVQIIFSISYLK